MRKLSKQEADKENNQSVLIVPSDITPDSLSAGQTLCFHQGHRKVYCREPVTSSFPTTWAPLLATSVEQAALIWSEPGGIRALSY